MGTAYESIILQNLRRLYNPLREDLAHRIKGERHGMIFRFRAFGEECSIGPDGVMLSGNPELGPKALVILLYALHASPEPLAYEPFKAFKDLPNTAPYHGAFAANSEKTLVPHVPAIQGALHRVKVTLDGLDAPRDAGGDFAVVVHPLPKIALCYVFYLPDEEFPASAACLLSANAINFAPTDALADLAEYTSRKVVDLVKTVRRESEKACT